MRGATRCAQRLKQVFRALRSSLGKVNLPQTSDPVTQAILGIFSRDMPESKAREVLERLRSQVVDYNELRVISVVELVDMVGEYPDVRLKCEDLSRMLNKIFAIEHTVSLDRLKGASRKDVVAYLDRIDGLEPYSRARARLLGFGHPAVPLDEAMWAFAREKEIVDPKCTLDEAQAFLERNIADDDAVEFFALLRKQAWNDFGNEVRKGTLERIRSVPPDRTSRNMLRQVAGLAEEAELAESAAEDADPDAAASRSKSSRRRSRAKGAAEKSTAGSAAAEAPAGRTRSRTTARSQSQTARAGRSASRKADERTKKSAKRERGSREAKSA